MLERQPVVLNMFRWILVAGCGFLEAEAAAERWCGAD
jgi:hypothetical protein